MSPAPLPNWLQRLYPFSPYRLTLGSGAILSCLDEGPRSADAVLMLHGNPTWSFYFRHLITELRAERRCVAPDHVGMGLSEKPERYEYRLARRITDVEELVERLGLRQIDLVVHDWGGAIGFGLAARRPELIRRIVILNTAAFVSSRVPARISLCRAGALGKFIVRGLNGFAGPATWMTMHRRKLTRDERRAYLFPYDSWAHRVAVHEFVRDIPLESDHPSRPTLEKIEQVLPLFKDRPKLIVWGGRDFCFNDQFLARWQEIYPEAQVERLADVGHYVLEDGGSAVTQRIANFLR